MKNIHLTAAGLASIWLALCFGTAGHLASGAGRFLFYKSTDRSGVLAHLSDGALITDKQFGANAFGSWTHIVGYQDGFLFYDASSGAGALAQVRGSSFVTTMTYPAGAFARWTHLVSAGT